MSGKTKTGKHRSIVCFFTAVLIGMFFQKNVPAQAAGVSGYIFPDSAQRYMSEEELYDLPLQIINYGKNEIYARHGRRFRSQELQAYFDGQSWYSGSISPDDFDENSLNEYERINAHMINDFEHQYNAEGYKLDQGEYSYEEVYAYLTQEENMWNGENEGGNGDFEEGESGDFGAADGSSDTEKNGTEDEQTADQENDEKEEEMLTEDNMKTEGQQEETVTYDDWIRLNMVPTLGVCGNGTFANIVSNNDYGKWLEQAGIISRYEEDLDGDGATEAFVVYLKKDEENSFVNLHAAVLKKQGDGIKITQDMDCMKIWGMAEDTQLFTFEQAGRKYFVLQSFCQFNGISERLTVFHVTAEGKIEADCIISDPGYTSGLALQKIEGEWNGDRMYSENDYENTKDLYSYDGTDELMECAENPAYGEAFNGQIQPYGLEAAVSETAFHASMWRVKEDDLTELCRVYAASESMGMTTDGVLAYQYTYNIYDNTGIREQCDYYQEAGERLAEIAVIGNEEATENGSQDGGQAESPEEPGVYTNYLEETWLDRDVTCAAVDVDNDGAEELLIRYNNTDANCEIYKADAASGEVRYIGQIAYVYYDLYWSEKYEELVQFSRSAGSETYSFYRFENGAPEFDFGVSWMEVNNVDKRITGYSYFSDSDRHELGRYEVAQAEEEDPQAKAEASKEYRAYLEDMVLIEFSPVLDFIWKNESASR